MNKKLYVAFLLTIIPGFVFGADCVGANINSNCLRQAQEKCVNLQLEISDAKALVWKAQDQYGLFLRQVPSSIFDNRHVRFEQNIENSQKHLDSVRAKYEEAARQLSELEGQRAECAPDSRCHIQ